MKRESLLNRVIVVTGFPFSIPGKFVEWASGDTYADIYRKSGLKHDKETQVVLEYDAGEVGMDACPGDYFPHVKQWDEQATPGHYLFLFPRSIWEESKKKREI